MADSGKIKKGVCNILKRGLGMPQKNLFELIQFWRKSRIVKTGKTAPSWIHRFRKWVYGLALLALVFLIFESGLRWHLPPFLAVFSLILDYGVLAAFVTDAWLTLYYTIPKKNYLKNNWMDFLVLAPLLLHVVSVRTSTGLIVIRNFIVVIKGFTRTRKFSKVIRRIRLNTPQIVAISFAIAILLGTVLLTFPTATTDGKGAHFIDALFTATSATCVTGLIVQDTPTYFTPFGQTVLLVLIQLGGLGIMTFSAFVALLFGRFSLGQRKIVQEMFEEDRNILNMVFYILKMTLFIETIGTLLLFLRWYFHFRTPFTALYFSVFHSISAFCNAGFSLFSDSMSGFVSDPAINIVLISLILLGGFGFIVVFELTHQIKRSRKALSSHTKLVLITSGILIAVGFVVILFFEFDRVLLKLSFPSKLWAALFQSVTTRTAGFNTISIGSLSQVTLTVMILLMFIGASPGSTGGGIKTTTFAVLVITLKSIFKRQENIEVFKRTVPTSTVTKALALLVSAFLLIAFVFLLLLAVENKPYLPLLFETISAFGTVGLSTGITPDLTVAGKLLITFLMYLGRIGPLTMGLALAREMGRKKIAYPDVRIMIG